MISPIRIFMLAILTLITSPTTPSRILIKIPTKGRPEQFFSVLDKYYENLSTQESRHFLIACDIDDPCMNNPTIIQRLQQYPNLSFSFGLSRSKIEAYNRDLHRDLPFDILIMGNDTTAPCYSCYDTIIEQAMAQSFSNLDGIINFQNDTAGKDYNEVPIMGKTFFDRFGYAYHPSYISSFHKQELTIISRILNKEKKYHLPLFKKDVVLEQDQSGSDSGQERNRNDAHAQQLADYETFKQHQACMFALDRQEIDATPVVWSILICTLDERSDVFNKLYTKLVNQIKELNLENSIEVLYFKDNRTYSVGFKRNELLHASKGKYICYIDDDDDVHDQYIQMIYARLLNNPDCVSLNGTITFDGTNPRHFIHSLDYTTWFEHENVYFRPPNHLNPIRRAIAVQFSFPEKNQGEDADWSMKIVRSQLLKTQEPLDEIYYFYNFVPYK